MDAVLNYIDLVTVWCFFFSVIYIPARLLLIKKDKTLHGEVGLLLFHLSLIAVISQTLTDSGSITSVSFSLANAANEKYYSFVPFMIIDRVKSIQNEVSRMNFALVNIAGNVAIFIPVGFFSRWAFRMNVLKATLVGFALSLFVETVQIFLPRTTDVDDVILNTAGALIGALIWPLFVLLQRKIFRFKKNSPKKAAEGRK